jgi:hypothetical protein
MTDEVFPSVPVGVLESIVKDEECGLLHCKFSEACSQGKVYLFTGSGAECFQRKLVTGF